MSLIASARAAESTHWYTRDGEPMYTVESAKGTQRPTTLRDARKLNLVPSVTTILNVASKPALNAWMQRQVLMAALTLPKRDSESEDEYISRILDDSKEQGRAAADAGTAIHESIQCSYEGRSHSGGHDKYVEACRDAVKNVFGEQTWVCERAFAHELGFGGKVDMHAPDIVVDIKTKEFTDADNIGAYDEHLMQLAAYRVGLGMPTARCANVFVSRSVPGLAVVKEWPEEDLQTGWEMFTHLLSYWQLKNSHS
ncbi:hypothetical protein EBZ39_09135 [bacterium]|nr:hypothetical protein [bacterium]